VRFQLYCAAKSSQSRARSPRQRQRERERERQQQSRQCALAPPGGPLPSLPAQQPTQRQRWQPIHTDKRHKHRYRHRHWHTQILDKAHTHAQCQTVGNKLVPVVSLLSNNILMGINLKRLVGAGSLPLLLPPSRCCCSCCCCFCCFCCLASRCWPLFRMRSTLLFFFLFYYFCCWSLFF